jgi:hypothetical protein
MIASKPDPNQEKYFEALRRLTPEQRIDQIFELSEFARDLFSQALRRQHPDLPEADFKRLLLQRLAACHNSNY